MKPFNNITVSSTEPEPKSDVWVKHSKNLLRLQDATKTQDGITVTIKNNKIKLTGTATQGTTINLTDFTNLAELNSKIMGKTITLSSENIPTVELNFASSSSVYYMQITGLKKQTTKQISEEIIFIRFYIGGNVTLNAEFEIQVEFGDTATKYEEPLEDNIMVNDNGVYSSVLNNSENWRDLIEGVQYRKTNKLVEISIKSTTKYSLNSNQWTTLATLPEGYRPKVSLYIPIYMLENSISVIGLLAVDPNGAVSIKQSSGKSVSSSDTRGYINFTVL